MPEQEGIITATRPDDGYWARRVRGNPDGWLRIGDQTFALTGREVLGEARRPYLRMWRKVPVPMGDDFKGEITAGTNEPLHTSGSVLGVGMA